MKGDRRSSLCACGLPFVGYRVGGYVSCLHCDTRDCHDVLQGKHPSMECVDCVRLGTNWDARFESETP